MRIPQRRLNQSLSPVLGGHPHEPLSATVGNIHNPPDRNKLHARESSGFPRPGGVYLHSFKVCVALPRGRLGV
jgi:hypothetical protein